VLVDGLRELRAPSEDKRLGQIANVLRLLLALSVLEPFPCHFPDVHGGGAAAIERGSDAVPAPWFMDSPDADL
jgi:hypothetical protein